VTDRDTLLSAVLSDPSDDTARLVLADLLRESDDPEEAARGRFLWAGVTASRYRGEGPIEDRLYYDALAEIAAVAVAGFPARWLADLGLGPRPLAPGDWAWDNAYDRVTVRVGASAGTFERGLLAGLSVSLGAWYALAPAALAAWPLESAAATDVPGLALYVEAPGEGRPAWRLSAALTVQVPRRLTLGPDPGLVGRLGAAVFRTPEPAHPQRWTAEEPFPSRAALVARVAPASAALAGRLRDEAGDDWPPPPPGRT